MKKKITRKEANQAIEEFFRQTEELEPEKVRKIKRLAMSYNIKLGKHRKRFCEACYSDLKKGSVRITKHYKTVTCNKCEKRNKWKH